MCDACNRSRCNLLPMKDPKHKVVLVLLYVSVHRWPNDLGCCRIPAGIFTQVLTGQPSAVTRSIGQGLFAATNIIFVFESLSTLDSTFTSAAKLLGPEFAGLLENGVPSAPQTAKVW